MPIDAEIMHAYMHDCGELGEISNLPTYTDDPKFDKCLLRPCSNIQADIHANGDSIW